MFQQFVYRVLGRRAYIHLMAWRQRRQFTRYHYHDTESRLLVHFIKPGDVCLDVGANMGTYTFYLSRLVGAAGVVYSFEPVSGTFDGLMINLSRSKLCNVSARKIGMSNVTGVARITIPQIAGVPGHGRASLSPPVSNEVAEQESIELTTIDEFCRFEGLGRVDFIKMDIEGAELPAVQGAQSILCNFRPVLLLEIDATHTERFGYKPADLFRLLSSYGYGQALYWNGARLIAVSLASIEDSGLPVKGVYNYFVVSPGLHNGLDRSSVPITN
ncbi:MAG TPA: FkbM family methyltransferase [Anaerolineae bacterium]|nr:FkbM family methyltransferase [Anaerolineae bacterium]